MKTTFLNLVTPIAVIAVGLVSALSTNATEKSESKFAPVWGYKHVSQAIPCQKEQICSNSGTFVCTSNIDDANLYEKPEASASCETLLFRDTE